MPRNSSGVYSAPSGTLAVTDTTIASPAYNNFVNDISSAITGSLPRDGSAGMSAPLAMGNNKITGLANGALANDAASVGQIATTVFGTANFANDSVTYAKLQNISATARILGRKTAGAGDAEECSLSDILDFIGSAAQGDILYRGAASWARLAAGTAGKVLTTNGAGADPSWATQLSPAEELLTSGAASGATLDIVLTGYTSYRGLRFILYSFIPVTDGATLNIQFSTNGGSSFDSGGTDYSYRRANISSDPIGGDLSTGAASIQTGAAAGNAATEGIDATFTILDQISETRWTQIVWSLFCINNAGTPAPVGAVGSGQRRAAQNTDAIRFLFSSGNISSGKYAVYGMR